MRGHKGPYRQGTAWREREKLEEKCKEKRKNIKENRPEEKRGSNEGCFH